MGALRVMSLSAARVSRVLALWQGGRKSTHCIARDLGIDEADVCRILEEADAQRARLEGRA